MKKAKTKKEKLIANKTLGIMMESDEYGGEIFEYSSKKEREAGLKRLISNIEELDDGIERELSFVDLYEDGKYEVTEYEVYKYHSYNDYEEDEEEEESSSEYL